MRSSPTRRPHSLTGASPNRRATATPSPLPPLTAAADSSADVDAMPLLTLFARLRAQGAPEEELGLLMGRAQVVRLLNAYSPEEQPRGNPSPVKLAGDEEATTAPAAAANEQPAKQPKKMAKASRKKRNRALGAGAPDEGGDTLSPLRAPPLSVRESLGRAKMGASRGTPPPGGGGDGMIRSSPSPERMARRGSIAITADLDHRSGPPLYPVLKEVWPKTWVHWLTWLAECGILTTTQLRNTVLAASQKPISLLRLPKEALYQGKPRMLNELIVTQSVKKNWVNDADQERILATLDRMEAQLRTLGTADLAAGGSRQLLAAPLLCALIHVDRLDQLRPKLKSLGIHSVQHFKEQVEGLGEPGVSVISIPINQSLRAAREKPVSEEGLTQLLDFVRDVPGKHEGLEGVRLQGEQGVAWLSVGAKAGAEKLRQLQREQTMALNKHSCGSIAEEGEEAEDQQRRAADTSAAVNAASRAGHGGGGGAADVMLLQGVGGMPLVLGVPLAGWRNPGDAASGGSGGGGRRDQFADAEAAGTLYLALALRARMIRTVGSAPAIVVCTLTDAHARCHSNPPPTHSARGRLAWSNYHCLVEAAKKQVDRDRVTAHGCTVFLELHVANGHMASEQACVQLGYGLTTSPLRSVLAAASSSSSASEMASTSSGGGKKAGGAADKAEEKAIAAAFAMFDQDGSGEISEAELGAVAQQLGIPMSSQDLAAAMTEMDKDGSGEVDLAEFSKWYRGLSVPPADGQPGGMSKIQLLKLKAILGSSTIGALASRQPTVAPATPADAFVGMASLGAFLEAYGCSATPSPSELGMTACVQRGSGYDAGSWSVHAHGSKDDSNGDAVHLGVPRPFWTTRPPSADAHHGSHSPSRPSSSSSPSSPGSPSSGGGGAGGSAAAGSGGSGDSPIAEWGARLADALLGFLGASYSFQAVPGSGVLLESESKTDYGRGRRTSVY